MVPSGDRLRSLNIQGRAGLLVLALLLSLGQLHAQVSVKAGSDFLTSVGQRQHFIQPDIMSGTVEVGIGPRYGIGMTFLDQSSTVIDMSAKLSDVFALYWLLQEDFIHSGPFSMGYVVGVGGGYTANIFEPYVNGNWFFGSHLFIYGRGELHASLRLSRRLRLMAQGVVMHGSNGRLSYPNMGLNFAGGGLSLKYDIVTPKAPEPRLCSFPWNESVDINLEAGGGVHTCGTEWVALYNHSDEKPAEGHRLRRWPKASLTAEAEWRFSRHFSAGVTADLFYSSNASKLRTYDTMIYGTEAVLEGPGYSPLSVGSGLEFIYHYRPGVALVVTEGCYLFRHMGIRDYHGRWYQRAGVRIAVPHSPFFFGAAIKAQPFKAEYVTFSAGVRLARFAK